VCGEESLGRRGMILYRRVVAKGRVVGFLREGFWGDGGCACALRRG
jgi:hypothetical protein